MAARESLVKTYLLYGLGPSILLVILLVWIIRGRWAESVRIAADHPRLAHIVDGCAGIYVHVWVKGVFAGLGFMLLSPIALLVQPADQAIFSVTFAVYFLPGMLWAITKPWVDNLRAALRNTVAVLHDDEARPPILIAYLRDRLEERREEVWHGVNGHGGVSHVQRGIQRLSKTIPEERIFGFWDPKDSRAGFRFSPLVSGDGWWKSDVVRLCTRATVIVLDISNCSESLLWEARLVSRKAAFRNKTLLLRSGTDEALPPGLASLPKQVRWSVLFESREEHGGSGALDLPKDFVAIAAGTGPRLARADGGDSLQLASAGPVGSSGPLC